MSQPCALEVAASGPSATASVLLHYLESEEPSCTPKCRSSQHGNTVCIIGSRGSDSEVINLWAKTCHNYGHVKDYFGRTALHIAASYGKLKAVEWLLRHEGSNITAKDLISGYTALHRSVYFGQLHVARLLISAGASLTAVDNEGLQPLDIAVRDRSSYVREHLRVAEVNNVFRDSTELFVWGSNDNYNLGIGSQSGKVYPELLDEWKTFGSEHFSTLRAIREVVLQTYHSLFLSQSGDVFACGLGRGGRLGSGNEESAVTPQLLPKFSDHPVMEIAAGQDHTMFVTSNFRVYSCGLNDNFVLGINPPPEKLLIPRVIPTLIAAAEQPAINWNFGVGIACSSTHSVFSAGNKIYTWGTNEGQLGHPVDYGTPIILPKQVIYQSQASLNENPEAIDKINCNEIATVFRTAHKVFILYRNECKRIRFSGLTHPLQSGIVGGIRSSPLREKSQQAGHPTKEHDLSYKVMFPDAPLSVILLAQHGRLFIWRENTAGRSGGSATEKWYEGTVTRVIFGIGRLLTIKNFSVNLTSLLIVTEEGECFRSNWNCTVTPNLVPYAKEPKPSGEDEDGTFQVSVRNRANVATIDVSLAPLEMLRIRRLSHIYYGVKVESDPKGYNYAIIQWHHTVDVLYSEVRPSLSQDFTVEVKADAPPPPSLYRSYPENLNCPQQIRNHELQRLLAEASTEDTIHDVEFVIGFTVIPAHRFVIACHCASLYNLIKEEWKKSQTLPIRVAINSCDIFSFTQILQFIYTDTCDLLERLKTYPDVVTEYVTLHSVILAARHYGMNVLVSRLTQLEISNEQQDDDDDEGVNRLRLRISLARGNFLEFLNFPTEAKIFDRREHEDLADIALVGLDGLEVKVHRCILVAKIEYFQSMFSSHFWTESTATKVNLPVSESTLSNIIGFIYTGRFPGSIARHIGLDGLVDTLRAADQYVMPNLVEACETFIPEYVSLKNVAEIFRFSSAFNAVQLKRYCMELISVNVAPLLENKLLDSLSEEEMEEVSKFYRENHPRISSHRVLTPDPNAPDYEVYADAAKNPIPELEEFLTEGDMEINQKRKSTKQTKVKARIRGFSETENDMPFSNSEVLRNEKSSTSDTKVNPSVPSQEVRNSVGWTKIVTPRKKSLRKSVSEDDPKHDLPPTPLLPKPKTSPLLVPVEVKKPIPLQPTKSLSLPIIIPAKAQAMKRENENMRALEVKFESVLEFPTLGGQAAPSSSVSVSGSNALKTLGKQTVPVQSSPPPSPSASNATPPSKGPKKKIKWVALPVSTSSKSEELSENSNPIAAAASSVTVNPAKNPWKVLPAVQSPITAQDVPLESIIKEEQQKNENFQRAMRKPLSYLQIEEEAVQQLTSMYTTQDTLDDCERLKVERVTSNLYANPTWVTPSKNPTGASINHQKGPGPSGSWQ